MSEPSITINGHLLTPAQAMTIRVAIGTFAIDLQGSGLGEDEHGQLMHEAYTIAIRAIVRVMQDTP